MHNKRMHILKFWREDTAQAMTETVIGLSLLCMTWVMLFYTGYMGGHRVLCAVAARHAAWGAGNGADVTQETIRTAVFSTNRERVTLTSGTRRGAGPDSPNVQNGLDGAGSGSSGIMGTVINGIVGVIRTIFPDIHTATVRFGVGDQAEAQGVYPFVLTTTRFPFMEETWLERLAFVEAYCEWDEVSNTWDSLGGIFDSIVSGLF